MFAFSLPVPLFLRSLPPSSITSRHPSLRAQTPAPRREESAFSAAAATFILMRAAQAYLRGERRPAAPTVRSALLQLEREQRRNRMACDLSQLYGQWRLVFTADRDGRNMLTKALYFPVRAQQTFIKEQRGEEEGGVFDNGVFFFGGWASYKVVGPFRWVRKRNRLEFCINRTRIKVGSWQWSRENEGVGLEGMTAKTLPFFTFFAIRKDVAAARGRTGGMALYARVPNGEEL